MSSTAAPRVSTRQVFTLLACAGRRPDEAPDAYLSYVATRRHRLGAYRGASSGDDDESRAFAAAYFQQLGLAVQPSQVSIFCGGFKGALICTCAAVMSLRRHDELRHTGGLVLAPVGYYQSLRLIPAIFGGAIEAVTDLDGDAVSTWLASTRRRTGRLVYIPLVNNADGSVVSRAFGRVPQTGELSGVAALKRLALDFLDADARSQFGIYSLDDEARQLTTDSSPREASAAETLTLASTR